MYNSLLARLKSAFGRSSKPLLLSRAFSEESIARYRVGGYHPVRIGDVFNNGRYKVVCKLGYGIYSTVWLACDLRTKQHVAMKILTADSYGHEQDTFELDILKHIKAQGTANPGANHILGLLDDFEHHGPHGNHICLVSKPMGPDMSKYRRLFSKPRVPIPVMKKIVKQLLFALAFLHDTCRIIHTDIKPQNILIETSAINEMFEKAPSEAFQPQYPALDPPNDFYSQSEQLSSAEEDLARASDVSVRLADFGTSSWFSKHLTEWIQPQMLRAPEVILGADWDFKADIWTLGLIIWEFAEGALVFGGTWTATAPYTSEAHFAQMEAVLGNMPESLLVRSKNRDQYFDSQGNLLMPSTFPPLPLEEISRNPDLSVSEQKLFLDFIKSMIRLDPKERHDARSLLDSEWLNQP